MTARSHRLAREPRVPLRLTALLAILLCGPGTLADRAGAQSSVGPDSWVITHEVGFGVRPGVAFDSLSRSAVVVWHTADGVWMRRASLETGDLAHPRRLMRGRGFFAPRVALLPAGVAHQHSDMLVVVERGGHLLAQGFGGDGAPLGGAFLLSRGLPPQQGPLPRNVYPSLLVTDGSVVVAWPLEHDIDRVLVTRVDRSGRPLTARRAIRTLAFQPMLVERPAAEGPGFLLATLNPDALIGELSHTLRTFDLQGEQLSVATRPDWPDALVPYDEESLLELVAVSGRETRVEARRINGTGASIERLGAIGPAMRFGTRWTTVILGAAVDETSGLAVTYGAGRTSYELASLDLVLFDPDLRPARGRIVPLSSSPAGVTPPVWTDRGEVLVAWNDTSHRQVLLGRISAPD